MGSRLGRRVVNFANLPIKLLMPKSFTNITEIALKTIPSASKIEIKRVLESLYGFEVEKVQTLNMDGKKKKYGGTVFAKPDYKKAYVTLRSPLSIDPELFPIRVVEEEMKKKAPKKLKSTIVEDPEAVKKSHWLDSARDNRRHKTPEGSTFGRRSRGEKKVETGAPAKFPWSSMASFGR